MLRKNVSYIGDYEIKRAIIDIGRQMYEKGFVAANDGNISCRAGENEIWATPTGVSKGFMDPDMLVKVDLDGNILSGSFQPSSELKMHLRVYKENPNVTGVTHAHPLHATSFSIAGLCLNEPILTETIMALGEIPVAPYATPGTFEVPESVAPFINTHCGVLLANHGVLTWGKDVYEAWYRMESIEHYATIMMYTGYILKQQNRLTDEQIQRLLAVHRKKTEI